MGDFARIGSFIHKTSYLKREGQDVVLDVEWVTEAGELEDYKYSYDGVDLTDLITRGHFDLKFELAEAVIRNIQETAFDDKGFE